MIETSLSVTTKNLICKNRVGGSTKKITQKGELGQFADLKEAWSERGGGFFEGG